MYAREIPQEENLNLYWSSSFFVSHFFNISIRVYSYFILVNFYFILMCDEKRYYIHMSEDYFHGGFFSEHTDEYLGLIKKKYLEYLFQSKDRFCFRPSALHFSARTAKPLMQKYAHFYMYRFSTNSVLLRQWSMWDIIFASEVTGWVF